MLYTRGIQGVSDDFDDNDYDMMMLMINDDDDGYDADLKHSNSPIFQFSTFHVLKIAGNNGNDDDQW